MQPTRSDRGWFINPINPKNQWWLALVAALPALLVVVLIFLDQQITAVIVNRKEHKLKVNYLLSNLQMIEITKKTSCNIMKCDNIYLFVLFLSERTWVSPRPACDSSSDFSLFYFGTSLVCSCHSPCSDSRHQPQKGVRSHCSWGKARLPGDKVGDQIIVPHYMYNI